MSVVLLVEDDAELLAAISDGLVAEGWKVLAATSVSQALELSAGHAIDIVLSDMGLADGDGEALRRPFIAAGLPVVLMTGSSLRERETGPSSILIKPFDTVDAAAFLERALSKHRRNARRSPRAADRKTASTTAPTVVRAGYRRTR